MTQDISTLDFVAFDTETTGLYPSSEALVEIAAVRFNLREGALSYFQTLVNPERRIPFMATRIHGIDDEMVADQPKLKDVMPQFYSFIEGAIPVAHNAPFDIGFIGLYSIRLGLTPPSSPILDSCVYSRRIFPHLPSHKLETLVKELSIGENTFHRALADARSCMELFRILVAKSCGDSASWDQLISCHGRTYGFITDSAPRALTSELSGTPWEPLIEAIENSQALWIDYEGGFGPREVTPLLVYAKGSKQYLEATCHLDGIRKNFRLDKIKRVFPHGLIPEA